ncbi:MAG: hypothetical protein HY270_20975 [Deltaproteobacteria bacterium]|nr:hypothetical protein [Deltaproteobacteria bacterium]
MTAQVVAVAASAQNRETLSILLEDQCQLQFLTPATVSNGQTLHADMCLVCEAVSPALLDSLQRLYPKAPILIVGGPDEARSLARAYRDVVVVALQPNELRRAVSDHLRNHQRSGPSSALARAINFVVEPLPAALAYPSHALRTLPLHAAQPASTAIIASILIEQAAVLDTILQSLVSFVRRPVNADAGTDFFERICREIARLANASTRITYRRTSAGSWPSPVGPTALVPLLCQLLSTYLRRRIDVATILLTVEQHRLSLEYPTRVEHVGGLAELVWRLSSLALDEHGWRLQRDATPGREILSLEQQTSTGRCGVA